MVLYILRHERRNTGDFTYFSSLNHIGKHNVQTHLFAKFNSIQLDEIYSSPFKRTLDTVSTISQVKDIPIRIDWALSERLDDKDAQTSVWPANEQQNELHKQYLTDQSYIPTADIDYISSYVESEEKYNQRVDNFIQYLRTQPGKSILVVSHQSITERIIEKLTGAYHSLDMGECYEVVLDGEEFTT
jgi:broad specificity phosphatase PhoE